MKPRKNWIIRQAENALDWITDNYYLCTIIASMMVGFILGAIIL